MVYPINLGVSALFLFVVRLTELLTIFCEFKDATYYYYISETYITPSSFGLPLIKNKIRFWNIGDGD